VLVRLDVSETFRTRGGGPNDIYSRAFDPIRRILASLANDAGVFQIFIVMCNGTISLPEIRSRAMPAPKAATEHPRSKRRVLLVDDHPITRCGLRQLVNQQLNLEVCGEANNAEIAAGMSRELQPDAAIVDISLPVTNGIELTKTIRCCAPETAVLILTMHDESLYAEESMRAGAQGYLMKSEAPEKLVTALERLLRGDTYFSSAVKQKMLHVMAQRKRRRPDFPIDALSARELEVLRLMGDGYTALEIAERLGLSRKTIDTYREHLRRKLGIDDSNDLIRYAIQRRRAADVANAGMDVMEAS
jgi:DNA-binding NarL/FixJ family response regulator